MCNIELIVLDYISYTCKSYIAEQQHGFISKRSTTTNLVVYTSFIARALQSRYQIDAVYTDFSAAFDTINHQLIIAKLNRLGFNGSFLKWLQSYLVNRQMSVKIGDTISKTFSVTSGVPQGSHLGPYIFLLFLNDINFVLDCQKLSYADDFKLYYLINSENDAAFLQSQIDAFAAWCDKNRMILNPTKCSIISFSRKRTTVHFNYKLQGCILQRVNCVKDLGVMLDSRLTFREHIAYITMKSSKMLGFMFRATKHFRDIHCIKAVYCSLVRSILEYASIVWSPYYQNSILRLEAIQRKFVKFALRNLPWSDPSNLPSYEHRCRLIGLDSLCNRRNLARICFISDLILSHIDCSELLQLVNFNIQQRNLRSHNFLQIPFSRTNYGYYEPMSSMCREFNRHSIYFDLGISRTSLRKRYISSITNTPSSY